MDWTRCDVCAKTIVSRSVCGGKLVRGGSKVDPDALSLDCYYICVFI